VWNWLKINHEAATTAVSIFTSMVTLAALIATIVISSRQLDLMRSSLQNSLIYQLQKDERAIGSDFLTGRTQETGPIFAEMQSVYLQWQLGSIPDNLWRVFQQDFCKLMSKERLRRDWDNLGKDAFSQDFVSYVSGISKPDAPVCGGGKP
jgi:hypothetical protein